MDTMPALESELVKQARIELRRLPLGRAPWHAKRDRQPFQPRRAGATRLMLINPEGYFWSEVTASSL